VSAILVTGGAGFIGSHVVDGLVGEGHDVTVLDNLHPAAHRIAPGYLNPTAQYLWGDLRDVSLVEQAARGVDAVSHQAGMVGLGTDFGDVADYVDHNDAGTAALLLALHRAGFQGRLVLGSSMVVYGEGRYRCARHGVVRPGPRSPEDLQRGAYDPRCPSCGRALVPLPIPETARQDPRNVYAATKLHQEHLCAAYSREEGASAVILRYHNVYGPRMPRDTPYAGVAAIFRRALECGEPPRVFEDGRQLRDFVHVRDVAEANLLALDPEAPPGAFNVASGEPHTVGEMASALSDALGSGPPRDVTGEFRLGDVRHIFASPDRARRRLGFRATVRFREGMAELARAPLRPAVSQRASDPEPRNRG
jgi:dTDP-L-rhamnose 4-epimerase